MAELARPAFVETALFTEERHPEGGEREVGP
jgi:hypothetical protein